MVGREQRWGTLAAGGATYVLVPIEEVSKMPADEIGGAVKSLLDEARITHVRSWLDNSDFLQPRCGYGARPNTKYVNFCITLANGAELEREVFRELELLKDRDNDLRRYYADICKTIEETLCYLRTKRSKMTPGQERARAALFEMRHGCRLCGLLDGRHSAACMEINKQS